MILFDANPLAIHAAQVHLCPGVAVQSSQRVPLRSLREVMRNTDALGIPNAQFVLPLRDGKSIPLQRFRVVLFDAVALLVEISHAELRAGIPFFCG